MSNDFNRKEHLNKDISLNGLLIIHQGNVSLKFKNMILHFPLRQKIKSLPKDIIKGSTVIYFWRKM